MQLRSSTLCRTSPSTLQAAQTTTWGTQALTHHTTADLRCAVAAREVPSVSLPRHPHDSAVHRA